MNDPKTDAGMIEWKDDSGKRHTAWFKETTNEWAVQHGLPYIIEFSFGEFRYAKILKTVVHVAVDEDENGNPVMNTWKCKTTFFAR